MLSDYFGQQKRRDCRDHKSHGGESQRVGERRPVAEGLHGWVLREGRPVVVENNAVDPRTSAFGLNRTGPSPTSAGLVRNGDSATFQWTGRLSPGGTMGFSASASATSAHGPFTTGIIDCGVTGLCVDRPNGAWQAARTITIATHATARVIAR